jgi:hypothetical protein
LTFQVAVFTPFKPIGYVSGERRRHALEVESFDRIRVEVDAIVQYTLFGGRIVVRFGLCIRVLDGIEFGDEVGVYQSSEKLEKMRVDEYIVVDTRLHFNEIALLLLSNVFE